MTKNIIHATLFAALMFGAFGCSKDSLQIQNPNAATVPVNVTDEAGLVSFTQGATYINGFVNGDSWLGNSYFSLPWGYSELLADNVGADASNNQISTIATALYYNNADSTVKNLSSTSVGIIKAYNNRAATANSNNATYYQWLNMYALNNAMNNILTLVDTVKLTGDVTVKQNTFKAWCYWWKGYAYQSIGLMYYSGVIVDKFGLTSTIVSDVYVSHDDVIARSNYYFNLAATTLATVPTQTALNTDYGDVLGQLIPAYTQTGRGGVPTPDQWRRSINTMLARNILLNKLSPFVNGNPNSAITKSAGTTMAAADWTAVLDLTSAANGIQSGGVIFTGRTSGANDFFTVTSGSVAAMTTGKNTTTTFKISERFLQYFNAGDNRKGKNFVIATDDKGNAVPYKNGFMYTTRYNQVSGGVSGYPANTYVYCDNTNTGNYELIIAGSYEENALMQAEALIRTNNIEGGLGLIDAVRTYLGAGVATVAGKGFTLSQALTELVAERRVALVYRGISYYDNRRYGWIYDITNGGGSYGQTIVNGQSKALVVMPNCTVNYNFMDWWDVPADESVLNPPDLTKGLGSTNPLYND